MIEMLQNLNQVFDDFIVTLGGSMFTNLVNSILQIKVANLDVGDTAQSEKYCNSLNPRYAALLELCSRPPKAPYQVMLDEEVELLETTQSAEKLQSGSHGGHSTLVVIFVKQSQTGHRFETVALQTLKKVLQMRRIREYKIVLAVEHPDGFVMDLAICLKNRERRRWNRDIVFVDIPQVRELVGNRGWHLDPGISDAREDQQQRVNDVANFRWQLQKAETSFSLVPGDDGVRNLKSREYKEGLTVGTAVIVRFLASPRYLALHQRWHPSHHGFCALRL